ncbi:hypothetical protein B7Y94_05805 [Candidatus Saccharibacteria bacterium 32-49-12]|nr:MAG: hypothetical protein B7Y94_05805 [Candidatus Saccharibacteria bacterium 32-49-12]
MGGVVGVCLMLALLVGHLSSVVLAVEPWEVAEVVDDSSVDVAYCQGRREQIVYAGSSITACVSGRQSQLASFFFNGANRVAWRSSVMSEFLPIEGVCLARQACHYDESNNRLIDQSYGDHFSLRLSIHELFSQRVVSREASYEFNDDSNLSWALKNPTGVPVVTGKIGLSTNGRWAAIEQIEGGVLFLDINSRQAVKISSEARFYDRGYNPRYEFAVANDGRTVAVGGGNVGFGLIEVSEGCGIDLDSEAVADCSKSDWGVIEQVGGLASTVQLRFSNDSQSLNLVVIGYDGHRQAVLLKRNGPTTEPPDPPIVPKLYMALGDSFTSGEGELEDKYYLPSTNLTDEKCHVSRRSYPYLLQTVNYERKNIACSGAKIDDIAGSSTYWGQNERLKLRSDHIDRQNQAWDEFIPGRRRQIDFVARYQPNLVTLSIGGNDSGLMDKLRACAGPGECRWVNNNLRYQTADEIDRLADRLENLISRLKQIMSETSRLVVVGYPLSIVPRGPCDIITANLFSVRERQFLNQAVIRLNKVIASAASQSSIDYIDVSTAFAGAELCSRSQILAMNGLRLGDDFGLASRFFPLKLIGNESFHPTPAGHELLAGRIDSYLAGENLTCGAECDDDNDYWFAEAPARRVVSTQFDMIKTVCDDGCRLSTTATFAPNSVVRVSIQSDPIQLMVTTVDPEGVLETMIQLPESLSSGYHTLIVSGETQNGQPVEL